MSYGCPNCHADSQDSGLCANCSRGTLTPSQEDREAAELAAALEQLVLGILSRWENRREVLNANPAYKALFVSAQAGVILASTEKLQARIVELEGALRPFAECANLFDGIPPPKYFGDTDFTLDHHGGLAVPFTLADCRAARSALLPIMPDGEG